jgi:hypothetical protein
MDNLRLTTLEPLKSELTKFSVDNFTQHENNTRTNPHRKTSKFYPQIAQLRPGQRLKY